jgi:hypothetical protein
MNTKSSNPTPEALAAYEKLDSDFKKLIDMCLEDAPLEERITLRHEIWRASFQLLANESDEFRFGTTGGTEPKGILGGR